MGGFWCDPPWQVFAWERKQIARFLGFHHQGSHVWGFWGFHPRDHMFELFGDFIIRITCLGFWGFHPQDHMFDPDSGSHVWGWEELLRGQPSICWWQREPSNSANHHLWPHFVFVLYFCICILFVYLPLHICVFVNLCKRRRCNNIKEAKQILILKMCFLIAIILIALGALVASLYFEGETTHDYWLGISGSLEVGWPVYWKRRGPGNGATMRGWNKRSPKMRCKFDGNIPTETEIPRFPLFPPKAKWEMRARPAAWRYIP